MSEFRSLYTLCLQLLVVIIISTSSSLRSNGSKISGGGGGGLKLKLTPSHSPESPLYVANLTKRERVEGMIATSEEQLRKHKANMMNSSSLERLPVYRHGLYYTAEVTIGSKGIRQRLLIDTGANTIWTQCEPCVFCFPQRAPLYDSRTSYTFRHLECSHPLCQGYPYRCENGRCIYTLQYGGGEVSKGFAGNDSFNIQTDDGKYDQYLSNIIFGCSNENRFEFKESDGEINGILGLAMGQDSFLTQIGNLIDHRFSYCFVPYDELIGAARPFIIRFGTAVTRFPDYVQIIPVRTPQPLFYYFLPLLDVSVGRVRLKLPLGSFGGPENGGIFIDSGAPFTIIDSTGWNPYGAIIKAFSDFYDAINLRRMAERVRGLEVCYRFPDGRRGRADDIMLPMTFHFQGADYTVEARFMHIIFSEEGYFCVVIRPGDGFNILGAWQQQNKRIVYDVAMSRLLFYSEDCSKDVN